jgi:hypothetical protein
MLAGSESKSYRAAIARRSSGVASGGKAKNSRKYRSNPAGEMISRILAGSSPAFPEGVPFVARLDDQVTFSSVDHIIAKKRSHSTFEHEAVLVFSMVTVQRRL